MRLLSPEPASSFHVELSVTTAEELLEDYDRYYKASESPLVNVDRGSSYGPSGDNASSKTPSPKKRKIETTEQSQQSPKPLPKIKHQRIVPPKVNHHS